jgi:hypothetical protein
MNCQQCQRRLMSVEKPEFPDLPAQAHLAECLACRDFQRQLVLMESNVPRVPVPASQAKARLLQQLRAAPSPVANAPSPRAHASSPRAHQPGAYAPGSPLAGRWHEVGIGLAAAVVLIACGLWLGNMLTHSSSPEDVAPPQAQNQSPDAVAKAPNPFKKGDKQNPFVKGKTLVAKLMACDLKLAQAQTPKQRVEALAELASLLHRETTELSQSAGPAELNKLAALYKQVIQDGMLPQARELPMDERMEVLPGVTAQLAKAERDAAESARATPRSAAALQAIAAAAHDGDVQLRELMQEGLE